MGYLGSKAASGVFQKIIAMMPVHDTYIETHLGGGAIMLRKPMAAKTIGVDIDSQTISDFAESNSAFISAGGVQLDQADCVQFLQSYDFQSAGRVLVYSDPPYMPETRSSKNRYRHEYSVADHLALIKCLRSLPANVNVMLSGYPSETYDHELADWHSCEFQAMTRGGVRTEKLWVNFDPAAVARFSAAYAGEDYEDRRRIKRKAERWRKKYLLLSQQERMAIMAELAGIDFDDANARKTV